jgi:hypothetical protein
MRTAVCFSDAVFHPDGEWSTVIVSPDSGV